MYDDMRQEQDAINFISNKIKRCRKCGNELDYKEKFYFSDRICCACKGIPGFDDPQELPEPVSSRQIASDLVQHTDLMLHDKGQEQRTSAEQALFNRYPVWQMMNEQAAEKWREEHKAGADLERPAGPAPAITGNLSVERINALMEKYDNGAPLDVSQEELISLLWEVLYHRKITSVL